MPNSRGHSEKMGYRSICSPDPCSAGLVWSGGLESVEGRFKAAMQLSRRRRESLAERPPMQRNCFWTCNRIVATTESGDRREPAPKLYFRPLSCPDAFVCKPENSSL